MWLQYWLYSGNRYYNSGNGSNNGGYNKNGKISWSIPAACSPCSWLRGNSYASTHLVIRIVVIITIIIMIGYDNGNGYN